jgi:hypothetical protein
MPPRIPTQIIHTNAAMIASITAIPNRCCALLGFGAFHFRLFFDFSKLIRIGAFLFNRKARSLPCLKSEPQCALFASRN